MEQWAARAFQRDTPEQSTATNEGALGTCEAYVKLIDLDLSELNEGLKDDGLL